MAVSIMTTPSYQHYDIPLIGGQATKIGRIIDLWTAPCNVTPQINAFAFFQAIPTLLWSAVKPEIIDTNIVDSHRHRKKKPRPRFDVHDIWRDNLIDIPLPRWAIFRAAEFLDRVGWYFLIADATEDFIINWVSTAYLYVGCRLPYDAYAYRTTSGSLFFINNNGMTIFSLWGGSEVKNANITNQWCQLLVGEECRGTVNLVTRPWVVPSQAGRVDSIELVDLNTGKNLTTTHIPGKSDIWTTHQVGTAWRTLGSPQPRLAVICRGKPGAVLINSAQCYFSVIAGLGKDVDPDP